MLCYVSVAFMHQYRIGQQHDAHEFLLSVISQIECDAGYVHLTELCICTLVLRQCLLDCFDADDTGRSVEGIPAVQMHFSTSHFGVGGKHLHFECCRWKGVCVVMVCVSVQSDIIMGCDSLRLSCQVVARTLNFSLQSKHTGVFGTYVYVQL